jgi:hypothetical protein
MPSNMKNDGNSITSGNNKGNTSYHKKEKTPAIDYTKLNPISLRFLPPGYKLLKFQGVCILIGKDGRFREYILHNPIGVTRLRKNAVVASHISEVPVLMARSIDPNASAIELNRMKLSFREAAKTLSSFVYNESSGLDYDPTLKLESRSKIVGAAKRQHRALRKVQEDNATKNNTSIPKANSLDWMNQVLDPMVQGLERELAAFIGNTAIKTLVEETYPDSLFETMTGVGNNVPQTDLGINSDGATSISDVLLARMFSKIEEQPLASLSGIGDSVQKGHKNTLAEIGQLNSKLSAAEKITSTLITANYALTKKAKQLEGELNIANKVLSHLALDEEIEQSILRYKEECKEHDNSPAPEEPLAKGKEEFSAAPEEKSEGKDGLPASN